VRSTTGAAAQAGASVTGQDGVWQVMSWRACGGMMLQPGMGRHARHTREPIGTTATSHHGPPSLRQASRLRRRRDRAPASASIVWLFGYAMIAVTLRHLLLRLRQLPQPHKTAAMFLPFLQLAFHAVFCAYFTRFRRHCCFSPPPGTHMKHIVFTAFYYAHTTRSPVFTLPSNHAVSIHLFRGDSDARHLHTPMPHSPRLLPSAGMRQKVAA